MPRDGSAASEETEGKEAERAPLHDPVGLAHSLSPVDLPDPPAPLPHGLRWTSVAIAWASLVLAFLNAHAIRDWSYQLPPNATSARVVTAAEAWYGAVDRAALNRPVEAMHAWWQAARDIRFQDRETGPRDKGAARHRTSPEDNIG
jgi:hypothetical protein